MKQTNVMKHMVTFLCKSRQLGNDDRALFQEAEAFRSSVVKGEVKAATRGVFLALQNGGDDIPF